MDILGPSRRHFLKSTFGLAAASMASGCSRALTSVAKLNSDVYVENDISYGKHPRQKLDLYLPPNGGRPTSFTLFLYGGSWRWGSKDRYAFVGYSLAKRGIATAVADYRLYPEARFPVFNQDSARAAAWLLKHHKSFGLHQSLNLMGHSAGAHIAASLVADPQYLEQQGFDPEYVQRFVGLSGPYGFRPTSVPLVADIFGTAVPETDAIPAELVQQTRTAMLLLHGGQDSVVHPKNSYALAKSVTEKGGMAEVKIYPNVGHRGIVLSLTNPFTGIAPTLKDTCNFLAPKAELT